MSKIKNSGLDQYGAEPFEEQQFGTAGVEGVNSGKLFLQFMKFLLLSSLSARSGGPYIAFNFDTRLSLLVVTKMPGRRRSLASSYIAVEFLSSRTRHEELVPAGTVLYAHIVRLAAGSRLQKHACSLTARIFCKQTNNQRTHINPY